MIYLLLGSLTGLLIGTVGIGGILLAPMLAYIGGMDLHLAMATSSWSFLFAGIAGTLSYARKGTIRWNMVGWLSVGIVPAALVGARANVDLQDDVLTVILAVLVILSGVNALLKNPVSLAGSFRANRIVLVFMGVAVGFGSALTGTGGPVLLVPLLIFLNVPALIAIGAAQAIQLPIAIFASVGFYLYGEINYVAGLILGFIMAIGVFVGAQISHRVSSDQLRRVAALVLVAVGLFMIAWIQT